MSVVVESLPRAGNAGRVRKRRRRRVPVVGALLLVATLVSSACGTIGDEPAGRADAPRTALTQKPGLDRAPATRAGSAQGTAGEIHFTFAGDDAVKLDWAGTAGAVRFGLGTAYEHRAVARRAVPEPVSSRGPFWEARVTGLEPGRTYHYTVGGRRGTFASAPMRSFRFDVEADVGDSGSFSRVAVTQRQIARDRPALVLVAGDLTYGNDDGPAAVDRHFDDVMAWSLRAAYMPAWGNHEWDSSSDDLRNYKGRFALPHAHASPGAPRLGCCGEDWGWFDAGAVRFISYPEPYTDATWTAWRAAVVPIFQAAEANPRIHFIVTFGHRPAYSTGYHSGDSGLAAILDGLGDAFPKYVLNLNGHSHDYERFRPIHDVVHITTGGGGAPLEPPSSSRDARTAFRALHLEHLRVDVTPRLLRIAAICGPSSPDDDMSCRAGSVIDTYSIRARR